MKNYIFDCVTFFRENFITNIRFEILKDCVDFFVICESKYDHKGNKKKLNFKLLNKDFKKKVIYIVKEKNFPKSNTAWQNQAIQREHLKNCVFDFSKDDDYIMFSDPDEIPNPNIVKNLKLTKKYGIFMQKCFAYKFNLFNSYESPWEGTRVCLKKNLKSIDFMRQKVLKKNLKYSFFRIDKEKSIQIINNGGWHFNNLMTATEISKKIKTFAHTEFSYARFSSANIIKKKIDSKQDLFERGNYFKKITNDKSLPEYILKNKKKFKKFID
jgi:beta-1,4-mannosyl-glycoprotein beta-1,4-N-acetylglucosaminyltransferase